MIRVFNLIISYITQGTMYSSYPCATITFVANNLIFNLRITTFLGKKIIILLHIWFVHVVDFDFVLFFHTFISINKVFICKYVYVNTVLHACIPFNNTTSLWLSFCKRFVSFICSVETLNTTVLNLRATLLWQIFYWPDTLHSH